MGFGLFLYRADLDGWMSGTGLVAGGLYLCRYYFITHTPYPDYITTVCYINEHPSKSMHFRTSLYSPWF